MHTLITGKAEFTGNTAGRKLGASAIINTHLADYIGQLMPMIC